MYILNVEYVFWHLEASKGSTTSHSSISDDDTHWLSGEYLSKTILSLSANRSKGSIGLIFSLSDSELLKIILFVETNIWSSGVGAGFQGNIVGTASFLRVRRFLISGSEIK